MNNKFYKILISTLFAFFATPAFADSATISCANTTLSPNSSTNCYVYVNSNGATGYGPATISTSGNRSISNLMINSGVWQGSAGGNSITVYSASPIAGSPLVASFTLHSGFPSSTSSESVSISPANLSDSNYNTVGASGSSLGITIDVPVPDPQPDPQPEPQPQPQPQPQPSQPSTQETPKPTIAASTEDKKEEKTENPDETAEPTETDLTITDPTEIVSTDSDVEVRTITTTTPKGVKDSKKSDGSLALDLALVAGAVLVSVALLLISASRARKSADSPLEP